MFGLLLSSACIALRFPCSHSVLTACRLGLCKQWGGDVARRADPRGMKGYSMPYNFVVISKILGGGGCRNVHCCGTCLPKQPVCVLRPSFPGDGWISACWQEAVDEFLILLCLLLQLLLYLKSSFISSCESSWFCSSSSFPHPIVGQWVPGWGA